jgi:cytochrome c biogenesis protein CcmG, thiol:disulfide interchange protein DsbE
VPITTRRARFFRIASAAWLLALLPVGPAASVGVGDAAPGFSLPTASGKAIALDTLRGQVVYVDFWASWCGPCRRSFPWMNEMQDRYKDRGLTVVAINVDKKRDDANRFLQANGARFAVVYDPDGKTPLAYDIGGMPSSYLIDRAGKVVAVEPGFLDERKAAREDAIRSLLAAPR